MPETKKKKKTKKRRNRRLQIGKPVPVEGLSSFSPNVNQCQLTCDSIGIDIMHLKEVIVCVSTVFSVIQVSDLKTFFFQCLIEIILPGDRRDCDRDELRRHGETWHRRRL